MALFFSVTPTTGQQSDAVTKRKKVTNKGKFFVYWGWNWASYSNSDIRFKGADYDFTLSNVRA